MAWLDIVNATQLTSITTQAVFQLAAADLKIGLNAGEKLVAEVRSNMGATDDFIVKVYHSLLDSPGDVPDAGQTEAGSDWSKIDEFTLDHINQDNEWVAREYIGLKWLAFTIERESGGTDTGVTADLRYRRDGGSV